MNQITVNVYAILINSTFGQSVSLSKGSYIKDVRTGRGEEVAQKQT